MPTKRDYQHLKSVGLCTSCGGAREDKAKLKCLRCRALRPTKEKRREYNARYRAAQAKPTKTRKRLYNRRLTKEHLVVYAGGACVDCGFSGSVCALHFHHLNSHEKSFDIGHNLENYSLDRLEAEVDKCALLCANCHAARHCKGE